MRVLIADRDPLRAKMLAEACEGRGHTVTRASHGATALELALEQRPDVLICPLELPVIDGLRLAEILRSNPRTRDVSFLFLVDEEGGPGFDPDPRDANLGPPWPADAALEHLDAVLERNARAGGAGSGAEMEGRLSQITVLDLLQLFQMNQKSGLLRVHAEGSSLPGAVVLQEGQIMDASVPLDDGESVVGEKALYRMLDWRRGRFEFLPRSEIDAGPGRIRKPMRALLLEGMRQIDEAEKQRTRLPAPEARLRLTIAPERVPSNVHPLTREVIDAIHRYRRVGTVVDRCSFPDYQVLRVITDLMRRGAATLDGRSDPLPPDDPTETLSLYTPTQIGRLREWAASRRGSASPVLKVPVLIGEQGCAESLFDALTECPGFRPDPRAPERRGSDGLAGTLGHFDLGEGLRLRVLALGAGEAHAPLWPVACHGMLGAVVIPGAPYGAPLEATEAVFGWLRVWGARSVLHLLLEERATGRIRTRTREHLATLEGGAVLVLPAAPSPDRVGVMRNLFARLVP